MITNLDSESNHPATAPEEKKTGYIISISSIVAIGGFLFGFDTAFVSGVIGFLEHQFSLSALMQGWVVSSALVGCILGVISAGKLSDRYGRKNILLLSAFLFPWADHICIYFRDFSNKNKRSYNVTRNTFIMGD